MKRKKNTGQYRRRHLLGKLSITQNAWEKITRIGLITNK